MLNKIRKVNRVKQLDLSDTAMKSIARSLADAGYTENDSIEDQILALANRKKSRQKPLKVTAAVATNRDLSKCPICQKDMEIVTVLGRKARYCAEHKVSIPMED